MPIARFQYTCANQRRAVTPSPRCVAANAALAARAGATPNSIGLLPNPVVGGGGLGSTAPSTFALDFAGNLIYHAPATEYAALRPYADASEDVVLLQSPAGPPVDGVTPTLFYSIQFASTYRIRSMRLAAQQYYIDVDLNPTQGTLVGATVAKVSSTTGVISPTPLLTSVTVPNALNSGVILSPVTTPPVELVVAPGELLTVELTLNAVGGLHTPVPLAINVTLDLQPA